MPKDITDITVLQQYLNAVMARADHHAGNVNEIALAVAGAIVWRKDPQEPIKVLARDGEMKNVMWVRINGQRFAFAYNHQTGAIEIRQNSTQGTVLHSITNMTSLAQLHQIFLMLGGCSTPTKVV